MGSQHFPCLWGSYFIGSVIGINLVNTTQIIVCGDVNVGKGYPQAMNIGDGPP